MSNWIKKDGASDADLMRAARDMFEVIEFAEFDLTHPGIVRNGSLLQEIRDVLAMVRGGDRS